MWSILYFPIQLICVNLKRMNTQARDPFTGIRQAYMLDLRMRWVLKNLSNSPTVYADAVVVLFMSIEWMKQAEYMASLYKKKKIYFCMYIWGTGQSW